MMIKTNEKNNPIGYVMIFPAMMVFFVFVLYPIIDTMILSLESWDGIGRKSFVGFDNYIEAFTSKLLWTSLLNNIQYCIGLIVFGMIPGLLLAYLLSGEIKGRTMFRTVFFFPRLCSMVIVSMVWSWIYNPIFGLVNKFFSLFSSSPINFPWLGNAHTAMFSVSFTGGWTFFGYCMVIYMAAFQNLSPDQNEAALLDGAGPVTRFFKVVLPQIHEVNIMVLILTIMDAFKIFDIIYLMTGGGPGRKTEILATYSYREAFRHNRFGYGAAIAACLTIFLLIISQVVQKINKKVIV